MSDRARLTSDLLRQAIQQQLAGDLNGAEFTLQRLLFVAPRNADALHQLGMIALQRGQLDKALSLITRAVAEKPKAALFHSNRGHILLALHRFSEAVESYGLAARRQPDFPDVHNGLGLALRAVGRLPEAEQSLREAVRRAPSDARPLGNLATVLTEGGRTEDAEQCLLKAIRLAPDDPQYSVNLALVQLLSGRLKEGFLGFANRAKASGRIPRSFEQPLWSGDALDGKILFVHAEEGFGDTIQFCRYISLIPVEARVIFEVPRDLAELMRSLDRDVEILVEGDALPPFDFHCPLLSLPTVFGTTLASIPNRVPYLKSDIARTTKWGERLASLKGFRVGIVWASGLLFSDPMQTRSMRFDQLAPLLDVAGATFVSLQKGPQADQLAESSHSDRVVDWTKDMLDFADTAALVDAMDLIVSVDTAVAHLAGSLGKPVWLMNRSNTCWRWLLDRTDSPWYPSLRQFRQTKPGNWDDVVWAVREALLHMPCGTGKTGGEQ